MVVILEISGTEFSPTSHKFHIIIKSIKKTSFQPQNILVEKRMQEEKISSMRSLIRDIRGVWQHLQTGVKER